MEKLADVQNSQAEIQVELSRVGVKNLKLPIKITTKATETAYKPGDLSFQHTVADVGVYVDLAADKKGANMSRGPVILQKESNLNQPLNQQNLILIAEEIRLE